MSNFGVLVIGKDLPRTRRAVRVTATVFFFVCLLGYLTDSMWLALWVASWISALIVLGFDPSKKVKTTPSNQDELARWKKAYFNSAQSRKTYQIVDTPSTVIEFNGMMSVNELRTIKDQYLAEHVHDYTYSFVHNVSGGFTTIRR